MARFSDDACPSRSRRRARWTVLLGAGLLALGCGPAHAAEPPRCSRGVLIRLEGFIGPRLEQYLYRKLDVARDEGADLVVVEIDSPGGLVDSSLNMAARLRDLDFAHTVAYVPREALSGAAIAALGCDDIVMHPRAMLGDAGPIFADENFMFRHADEKFVSYLAEQVRNLAQAKGRPPALAEAMVDRHVVVYRVEDKQTGDVTYMSEQEIASDADPDRWQKGEPVFESREGHFLQASGQRAVELGLAQATANSRGDVGLRYALPGDFLVLEPTGLDTAVWILNIPVVTGLILVIGLIALYVELMAPGIGVGGLLAGLCFAVFFWSRFLGGTAGWLEVVLFLAGLVFLAFELFVIPGFGVAGVSGILLLIVSLLMASQHHNLPSTSRDLATLTTSLFVLVGSFVAASVAAFGMSKYFGRIPILSGLALEPPAPAEAEPHAAGRAGLALGETGVAKTPLRPAGVVRFGDDYVDVVSEGAFIEEGSRVKIVKLSGNRVVVRET